MSLFQESDKKAAGGKGAGAHLVMQFDGGSRGNPGPAGIGVTLTTEDGAPVYELAEFLGSCTNNVAEYTGFLRGLTAAVALGAAKVTVRSDSELLVRQINGIYKVKSPDLKPLYQQAVSLMSKIGDVKVMHVYRESNSRADELANMAMDVQKKIEPLGPAGSWKIKESMPPQKGGSEDETEDFPRLHFAGDFDKHAAQDAEARGFLGPAEVELKDGSRHPVTFYAASRLAYNLEREAQSGRPFIAEKGLIVLRSVTHAHMLEAVRTLADQGFFDK